MDVKTTKTNRWCLHIKDYASKNGMSYRQAMRDDGCKTAYKSPEPSPEPLSVPMVETKPKGRKKAEPTPDPMPMPTLVRSEPEPETIVPLIPTVIKKVRVKRESKMVPV